MFVTDQEPNPYQVSPESNVWPASSVTATAFSGSATDRESQQVHELLTRQTNGGRPALAEFVGLVLGLTCLFGIFAFEAIYYDEHDRLFEMGLGACVVGAILGAGVLHSRRQTLSWQKLRESQTGVFSVLTGKVTDDGIDFLVGAYPLRFQWDDFVGAKCGEDAVALYIGYPKEATWLTRSMFFDSRDWDCVCGLIKERVPQLRGPFARWSVRERSDRMVHVAAATRALAGQDWNTALVEIDGALAIDPTDTQALQGKMIAVVGSGNLEQGLHAIQDVVNQVGDEDELIRRLRARVLIDKAEFELAPVDLEWLIQRTPDDSDALRDRGLALFKLGDFEAALRDASAAVKLNPDDFVALNNRGAALLEIGRKEEAIESLEAALAIAPPQFERPRELLELATAAGA